MYHSAVVPQIKPIAVEQALRAAIEPGFVLSGHIDVSEELDLHDLKTGKNQRANAAQYGAYALLRRSHGENANKLIEDYVRRGSLRTAQPQTGAKRLRRAACRADGEADHRADREGR